MFPTVRSLLARSVILLVLMWASGASFSVADEPSTAGPLMTLLKSGRLPPDRVAGVVELVCRRGSSSDLRFVFDQLLAETGGLPDSARLPAMNALAESAQTRKVKPSGNLAGLSTLLNNQDPDTAKVQLAALRLAGLWEVAELAPEIQRVALDAKASLKLRQAATLALVELSGTDATATLQQLTTDKQPAQLRMEAIAALANLDVDQAAQLAGPVLQGLDPTADLTPLLNAFLDQQGGADRLAAALAQQNQLSAPAARAALRTLYAVGRNDAALSAALSELAGISAQPQTYTKPQIAELAAQVMAKGDPHRGEAIFRRADLSCIKCHSVSKAGGQVGPDLSAVGSSSPPDYLLNSILEPSQAIKEQYKTIIILTAQGKLLTGIVEDRDDTRLILKTADGKKLTVAVDDIDDEADGASLMPKGLTKFLTQDELFDLVRFLSELGKPGEFAIRTTPAIQRWRVLRQVPTPLAAGIPDESTFQELMADADSEEAWLPAYGKVAGMLPLPVLKAQTHGDVLYIRGELNVTVAGAVELRLSDATGIDVWVDGRHLGSDAKIVSQLGEGRHSVGLRIDTKQSQEEIRVELAPAAGSSAVAEVVGGA